MQQSMSIPIEMETGPEPSRPSEQVMSRLTELYSATGDCLFCECTLDEVRDEWGGRLRDDTTSFELMELVREQIGSGHAECDELLEFYPYEQMLDGTRRRPFEDETFDVDGCDECADSLAYAEWWSGAGVPLAAVKFKGLVRAGVAGGHAGCVTDFEEYLAKPDHSPHESAAVEEEPADPVEQMALF